MISPILYVMCGVGFSGKSTLSQKIASFKNATLVSSDEIYFEIPNRFNKDDLGDWAKITDIAHTRIRENLRSGRSVVFDNTNTHRSYRDILRTIAKDCGAQVVVVYLDTPLEVQIERQVKNRLTKERHDVEQKHLDYARAVLEIPTEDENLYVVTPENNIDEWLKQLP